MAVNPDEDEALWKRRFEAFALVRLMGLLLLFGGLAVALKNPLGDEIPWLGAVLALVGAGVLLLGPRTLKRRWEAEE